MKFKMIVRDETGREWSEPYNENIEDAHKWAEKTIAFFNNTLRPRESKRTLIRVEIEEESNAEFHQWVKKTAGMSTTFRGRNCDMYECSRCGITGKRFGLSRVITIDSKYKRKAYQRCDTSLEYQKKMREMEG